MSQFEFRELGRDEEFDPKTVVADVPFTQARFYGEWQESLGRKTRRFLAEQDGSTVAYFQLIKYPLPMGKSYLYAPYGPAANISSNEFLAALKAELQRIAREEGAVFVRLDFTPPLPNELLSKYFTKAPLYTYHSAYFQPRAEWFLGLAGTEDELLKAMHEKTRYSIRLAERKGILAEIVTQNFERYFNDFYTLMAETARRNGFHLHEKAYYERIFRDMARIPNAYLSVAKYGEKVLTIDLVIVYGSVANYVFGGSSSEERNRMPTYLAQWKAILHAKALGCTDYNFGGIAEGDVYAGWGGLTAFKKKFGGHEIRHSDFFDLVIQPLWYHLYNLRKRLKRGV